MKQTTTASINRRKLLGAIGIAPLVTVPTIASGKYDKLSDMTPAEQIKYHGQELVRLAKENTPDGYSLTMIVVDRARSSEHFEVAVLTGNGDDFGKWKRAYLKPHQSPDWQFHNT